MKRSYIAIDLKSFYASVECVERHLDPLTTNLVVADESRTDKTICLAVSPSLKAYGLPGRCRLFEVRQKAAEMEKRTGHPLEYIVALPRMQLYMDYSRKIYGIYLKYISKEDIHVYSIDEVFMDVTDYLHLYHNPDGSQMSPHDLAMTMIRDVLKETGITATAGIGTNLYLAKIAMDIVAKHVPADKDGVRIACLDERKYREDLWDHTPLRSFWRVGSGLSKKLEANGMFTMGDIARMSLRKCYYDETSDRPDYVVPKTSVISGEDFLFKLFGIDAEILIDHAWGIEPVRMLDIKSFKPETNSLSSGQVLGCAYNKEMARLLVKEMADNMTLDLFSKHLVTNQITLVVSYDSEIPEGYKGELHRNYYGKIAPKSANGSERLGDYTSSAKEIMDAAVRLFDRIADSRLKVRRLSLTMCNVIDEDKAQQDEGHQLSIFDFLSEKNEPEKMQKQKEDAEKERRLQEAMLKIKGKYGKNALLRGMNLEEGATMRERNEQIGGHRK